MSSFINKENPQYGFMDTSYKAANGEEGLRKLSVDFYTLMDQLPEARIIREMHKENLEVMTDKLTLFLSMWLGGPKSYQEKYGFIGMPQAHQHLVINDPERDAWLLCMDQAVDKQNYDSSFKEYLKKQFRFPAEMIRRTSRSI